MRVSRRSSRVGRRSSVVGRRARDRSVARSRRARRGVVCGRVVGARDRSIDRIRRIHRWIRRRRRNHTRAAPTTKSHARGADDAHHRSADRRTDGAATRRARATRRRAPGRRRATRERAVARRRANALDTRTGATRFDRTTGRTGRTRANRRRRDDDDGAGDAELARER